MSGRVVDLCKKQLQMNNLQEVCTLGIEFHAESATMINQPDIR
jgi:hypothetical protein